MTHSTEEQGTIDPASPAKEQTATNEKPKAARTAKGGEKGAKSAPTKAKSGKKATPAKKAPRPAKAAKTAKAERGARQGSKTGKVLELLKRPDGASLKEIIKVTGWQPHSVRGFLSGTLGNKLGLTVNSVKGEDKERNYSIKS
jgi:hypothetical protein